MSLLLVITSSLWASDVSQMKILGIGLGDKHDVIKNKLPCLNKIDTKIEDKVMGYSIDCKNSQELTYFRFDHQGKIISIIRDINLDVEPDWNIIYQDLAQQYGKPEMIGIKTLNNYSKKTFCYGDCRLYTEGKNTEALDGKSDKSLSVFFRNKNGQSAIQFALIDSQAAAKNKDYIQNSEDENKAKKKQQASKIKF